MFTIDNNQVKINCKILGGTELIHMKDVKNHLKEATGGDVSTETMHETLTNLFNLTGGAEMVEKELVMSAYNQAGGDDTEMDMITSEDIDIDNLVGGEQTGGSFAASAQTRASMTGTIPRPTPVSAAADTLFTFSSANVTDFVAKLALAFKKTGDDALSNKVDELFYGANSDANKKFLELLVAQNPNITTSVAGVSSDASTKDKDAVHSFFNLLYNMGAEDDTGKVCLVLVALKQFSNMLTDVKVKVTPSGPQDSDATYMPKSVKDSLAGMLKAHGIITASEWDLEKLVKFLKNTHDVLKGGAVDTEEIIPITYSIGGAAPAGTVLTLTDFLIRSLTHLWSRDYLNGLAIKNALLEAIESGELGSPGAESWGPDDLVEPEEITSELNNWTRKNGRLQYSKDGSKPVLLMEHFDKDKSKAGLIGRTNDNMRDANDKVNLEKRFDVGCWTLGHSAYENQACMAQITGDNLWQVDKVKVFNEISPLVAFSIVKSLGFKGVQDTVTGKMKVQSVASWWSNTCDKRQRAMLAYPDWEKTTQDLDAHIRSAMNLKPTLLRHFKNADFLKRVVGYINANPDIINVTKETTNNVDPLTNLPYAKGLSYNTKLEDISGDLRFGLDNYSRSLYSSLDRFGSVFGVGPMFVGGGQRVDLSGGALAAIASPPRFAKKLRAVFESYVRRLASYKKKLTSETKRQIDELIDNLEAKEKQLRGILQHFRAYSLLVRSENDRAHEYISVDKMKEALEQFGAKYGKYRRRVIAAGDILNALNVASMDNSGANLPPALLEK